MHCTQRSSPLAVTRIATGCSRFFKFFPSFFSSFSWASSSASLTSTQYSDVGVCTCPMADANGREGHSPVCLSIPSVLLSFVCSFMIIRLWPMRATPATLPVTLAEGSHAWHSKSPRKMRKRGFGVGWLVGWFLLLRLRLPSLQDSSCFCFCICMARGIQRPCIHYWYCQSVPVRGPMLKWKKVCKYSTSTSNLNLAGFRVSSSHSKLRGC